MDARPRKRQKKLVVEDSADDDDDATIDKKTDVLVRPNGDSRSTELDTPQKKGQRTLPTRSRNKVNSANNATTSQPKASPTKARGNNGAVKSKGTKSKASKSQPLKPISAFFSEQPNAKARERNAPLKKLEQVEAVDAIEDDDSSSVESYRPTSLKGPVHGSQMFARQDSRPENLLVNNLRMQSGPDESLVAATEGKGDIDRRPWSDRFSPISVGELVVNSTKIKEVRSRLRECISQTSPKRMLVISGPSGSGKSVTLKLLAQEMDLDVVEWKNPTGSSFQSENYMSITGQFDDFINRSRHPGELRVSAKYSKSSAKHYNSANKEDQIRPKIIVIEDLPSNITFNSSILQALRFSVLQHLCADDVSLPSQFLADDVSTASSAIAFIFTQTSSNASTADDWAVTPRRVLGSDILDHSRSCTINFNPIATTFLEKALNIVIKKVIKSVSVAQRPAAEVVKKLSLLGDARSAINALQMVCIIPHPEGSHNSENLPFATAHRDANLGLFHAVGKVIYNKRETNPSNPCLQPPLHLSHLSRPKPSQVSVDELIDHAGTDTSTFIASLYENFAPSCAGPAATTSLDGCLEALSDADLLDSSRPRMTTMSSSMQESESLRKGEFAFNLAARGMLFALPHPVQRSLGSKTSADRIGVKNDSSKMGFPAVFRLMKETKEAEDLARGAMLGELGPIYENVAAFSVREDHSRLLLPALPEMMSTYLPYLSVISSARSLTHSKTLQRIFSALGFERLQKAKNPKQMDTSKGYFMLRRSRSGQKESGEPLDEPKTGENTEVDELEEPRKLLYLEDDDIEDD